MDSIEYPGRPVDPVWRPTRTIRGSGEKETLVVEKETLVVEKETLVVEKETKVVEKETPVEEKETQVVEKETPVEEKETLAIATPQIHAFRKVQDVHLQNLEDNFRETQDLGDRIVTRYDNEL